MSFEQTPTEGNTVENVIAEGGHDVAPEGILADLREQGVNTATIEDVNNALNTEEILGLRGQLDLENSDNKAFFNAKIASKVRETVESREKNMGV